MISADSILVKKNKGINRLIYPRNGKSIEKIQKRLCTIGEQALCIEDWREESLEKMIFVRKKKPETYFKRSSNVIPEVFQPETIL